MKRGRGIPIGFQHIDESDSGKPEKQNGAIREETGRSTGLNGF